MDTEELSATEDDPDMADDQATNDALVKKGRRQQDREIREAEERARVIKLKEAEIEVLRGKQHAFLMKAIGPSIPVGWRPLGPTAIAEIVGISRQRIHDLIRREAENPAADSFPGPTEAWDSKGNESV
jgi:hypothetical protein